MSKLGLPVLSWTVGASGQEILRARLQVDLQCRIKLTHVGSSAVLPQEGTPLTTGSFLALPCSTVLKNSTEYMFRKTYISIMLE